MEPQTNKGSMVGTVIAIIVIVGLAIYYFSTKDKMVDDNMMNGDNSMETSSMNDNSQESSMGSETTLEGDIQSFDSEFSDMNSADLDI